MAEEVNYASVVFKKNKRPQIEGKLEKEVTVYDEVKTSKETDEQIPAKNGSGVLMSDDEVERRSRYYQRLLCLFGMFCCCLLLGIVGLCVYFALHHEWVTSEMSQLKASHKLLLDDNHNLTNLSDDLLQLSLDLKREINNVSAENRNLTMRNEELMKQSHNLTEQIQNLKTQGNEFNVSRAQWSIDAYCPKESDERKCRPCQDGWFDFQSSCYAFNDAVESEHKTWEEARQNCRGKISDLVVVADEEDEEFVNEHSWPRKVSSRAYWLGLRVEDGRWKWVNGSYLTNNAWISEATDGHCAVSINNQGWKSVRCDEKWCWICEKKAILV
ncbi:asialoglycoprotein receptor 1-like [Cololabis saira]|uniref:asialoglycoprotein receptor 1-like n=1 Tax=Cololabis saira TaxID=129043 RepID=UPI002AD3B848|nr:asialoglycoprotein receptor 1-like [Cololabis saira]